MFEIVPREEMEDPRSEEIAKALIAGHKETTIARRFNVDLEEVESIALRCLPYLDERTHQRMRRMQVARLDQLQTAFLRKALDEGDAVAGTLVVRASEQLSAIA